MSSRADSFDGRFEQAELSGREFPFIVIIRRGKVGHHSIEPDVLESSDSS
jgi:hypothetical protein